ncbi:hypothetical protein P152DRAFT_181762 [Eremomyces bilateralis CBS 781.70]|uniref:Ubiquitin-like domain-containing protein n=1 Tax=Eremomyces bilateralis CBS 781.70 TaxID=1392243 RepID=A0A6G1GBC4_9PEZI|nr:uncharacterized protein P152DRAFT_181762 [Eremomyces bilateralis CBS 781.70]KAF1815314.1 hypothetical protein P152DRAFT_181762 [Eremomyces bilateralis CBS 781.70]
MLPQIGDFIACAKLAGQCIQALNSARGSKSEFTTLSATLKALSHAALQAEAVTMDFHISEHKDVRHIERLQEIAQEVTTQRLQIEECIKGFMDKTKSYTAAFEQKEVGTNGFGKAKTAYKSLTWLSRKEDIAFFEKALNLQLEALQLLLGRFYLTAMTSSMDDNRKLLTNGFDTVEVGINDVKFQMQEALFKLEMIWERGPQDMAFGFGPEAIILDDALGRQNFLPLMLTATPEVFRDVLLLMHKGGPGYEKVESGKYVVSDEDRGGELVPLDRWSETFQPGKRIGLSFLMKHPPSNNEKQCPRCMSMNTMTGVHPDERKCKHCSLRYKVENQDRVRYFWKDLRQRPKPPPKVRSAGSIPRDRKSSNPESSDPKKNSIRRSSTLPPDEYMHPFRRVHYQRPVIRRISIDARWASTDPEFDAFLQALPPTHRAAASGDTATLDDLVSEDDDVDLDEHWKPSPGNELFRHDRTGS